MRKFSLSSRPLMMYMVIRLFKSLSVLSLLFSYLNICIILWSSFVVVVVVVVVLVVLLYIVAIAVSSHSIFRFSGASSPSPSNPSSMLAIQPF